MLLESAYRVPYVRGLRVTRDIQYCLNPSMHLDLYEKRVPKVRPVLIYFHGGGFVGGDKSRREWILKHLATNDYSVINVNFGAARKYPFPQQIQYCALALKWVEEHAIKYSFDLNNVALGGDGSGAFLAAQLAILNGNKEYAKKVDAVMSNIDIKGLVLMRGVYDMTRVVLKAVSMYGKRIVKRIVPMFFEMQEKAKEGLDTESEDISDNQKDQFLLDEEQEEYFKLLDLTAFIDKDFPSTYITNYDIDSFAYNTSEEFLEKLEKFDITTWEVKGITIKGLMRRARYNRLEKKKILLRGANDFLTTLYGIKPHSQLENKYIQFELDRKELLRF